MLAILVSALAPTLSHALSAGGQASLISLMEVCTAIGAQWVQQDGDSADPASTSGNA